jgi:catechol 2,3-dioxygenase-like lactoylglutathione lyase family enzyme
MGVDNCRIRGQFLQKGEFLLELLEYEPAVSTRGLPYRDDDLGWTHLSFIVEDLDETGTAVQAHGGVVLSDTRTELAFGDGPATSIMFCTDPDGNRIELIQHSDDAGRVAHGRFLGADVLGWPPRPDSPG